MNLEQRIKEEEARFEELNQAFEALLKEVDLSREQLRTFVNDKAQFTETDWEQMETLRLELETRLENRLAKIPKTSAIKSRSSLASIQRNWIPVR